MLNLKRAVDADHGWKQAVTNDFIRGASVTDIATHNACARARVEQVLREAIRGLAVLTQKES